MKSSFRIEHQEEGKKGGKDVGGKGGGEGSRYECFAFVDACDPRCNDGGFRR